MSSRVKRTDVQAAIEELKTRTLPALSSELARFLYLASTRDYSTGRYYHDGLAFQFTDEMANEALAACHQEVFTKLVFASLKDLVEQLEAHFSSVGLSPSRGLEAWSKLEPYRVTIPWNCDPLYAEFFVSNLKIALAVLQARLEATPDSRPSA